MSNNNDNISIGCGGPSCSMLFIVFLVLKLTDTVDWSWWWVTCPLWIPPVAVLVVLLCAGVCLGVVTFISALLE